MARLNQRPSLQSSSNTPNRGRPSASNARADAGSSTQRGTLPPYQKPIQPLTPAAQRSLNQLLQTHDLRRLQQRLDSAATSVSNTAGDINQRLSVARQRHQRICERREKERQARGEHEVPASPDEDEPVEMEAKVRDLTDQLEEKVRALVDAMAEVEEMKTVVSSLADGSGAASTQRTARSTQRSTQMTDGNYVESVDGEGNEGEEADSVPPSEVYTRQVQDKKRRYEAMSMSARYATNNTYSNFRRIVHDSLHENDANPPPLPNPSTWFPDGNGSAVANSGEESDDEVAIAGEKLSLKCPLTLLPLKDPLTSKKCPHSFEKEAILGMIAQSTEKGPHREKIVQCPVCTVMLSESDLHQDPLLIRQIRRAQERANMLPEDEDDDGHPSRRAPESVASGEDEEDDDDVPTSSRRRNLARVKSERIRSSMMDA